MRFNRVIALITSMALILSSISLSAFFASANSANNNYYVLSGGTGDGRSSASPAATVAEAVTTINADSHGAGDTVNIYIMQHNVLSITSSTHNVTSWAHQTSNEVPAHTAKIVVQPYNEIGTTYIAQNEVYRTGATIFNGPTELRNIKFVGTNGDQSAILFKGNSVTLGEGVTYGCFNKSKGTVDNIANGFWKTSFAYWDGEAFYSNKIDINIENAHTQHIYLGDMGGNTSVTYKEDVNIKYDNPSSGAFLTWSKRNITFNKNLNIYLKNAKRVENKIDGAGNVIVKGGFQVITKSAITVTSDYKNLSNLNAQGGYWVIKNDSGINDLLSFTDTKGVFAVKAGEEVEAVNDADSSVVKSQDGVLSLPAGEYTISKKYQITKDYYVLSGATGDGRSETSPAPTVSDVINSINSDGLTVGDTAYIYIMQNTDWDSAKGALVGSSAGTPAHKITSWTVSGGEMPAYGAKIIVQSYGETVNYLAICGKLGLNKGLICGGPTEFKNIRIVSTRQLDTGIYINGKNVILGEGTSFGYIDNTQYGPDKKWNGKVADCDGFNESSLIMYGGGNYSNEMTVKIETKHNKYIRIGDNGNQNTTFKESLNLVYNHAETGALLTWGTGSSSAKTTFDKNVNINIMSAERFSNVGESGKVIINGGLQVITSRDTKIISEADNLSNVSLNGGYWFIKNSTAINDLLSFTDKKGEFIVKESNDIVAINSKTGEQIIPQDRKLVLPEGKYTIAIAQSVVITGGQPSVDGIRVTTAPENTIVTIDAEKIDGRIFDKWSVVSGDITLADEKSPKTTFKMPKGNVEIKAIYKGSTGVGKQMLYFKATNSGPLMQRFANAVLGETYSITFNLSSNVRDFKIVAAKDGDRQSVKIDAKRTLKEVKDGYTSYAYSFKIPEDTDLGKGNLIFVGISFLEGSQGYISDVILSDSTGKQVFKNTDFTSGLDNWVWGWNAWFGVLQQSGLKEFVVDTDTNKLTLRLVDFDAFDESFFGTIKEEKKMLYFRNGANARAFASRFILKPNTKYVLKLNAYATDSEISLAVLNDGDRDRIKVKKEDVIIENKGNYSAYTFKFTTPESLKNNGLGFVGIGIPSYSEGYLFDISCFIADDPNETQCFSNPYLTVGLSSWIWSFDAWFGIWESTPGTLTEFSKNLSLIRVENFDTSKIDALIASLNVNDGEWWDKSDIIEEQVIIETAAVKGKFTNQNNAPLANIKFVLQSANKNYYSTTDKYGVFNFKDIDVDFYELFIIGKDGKKIPVNYYSNIASNELINLDIVSDTSQNITDIQEVRIPTGTINGTIYTPDLKIVSNLTVYLDDANKVATDENGNFEFKDIPTGTYELYTLTEDGKKIVLKTVEIKENVALSTKLKYDISQDRTANDKPVSNKDNNGLKVTVIISVITLGILAVLSVSYILLMKRKLKKPEKQ